MNAEEQFLFNLRFPLLYKNDNEKDNKWNHYKYLIKNMDTKIRYVLATASWNATCRKCGLSMDKQIFICEYSNWMGGPYMGWSIFSGPYFHLECFDLRQNILLFEKVEVQQGLGLI